jgi:hypothetical protein
VALLNHEPTQDVYVSDTRNPKRPLYKISEGGGIEPRWPAAGNAIVYRKGWSWWAVDVAVDVALDDQPRFSAPRKLFEGSFVNVPGWSHDVSADGKRHLVLSNPTADTTSRLTMVSNWYDELRRAAPRSR